jgi:hypothetical protein
MNSTKTTTANSSNYDGFSDVERSAMKERAKELKATARRGAKAADAENEVLAKLAELPKSDRVIGERLHALIKANAAVLEAKLWYGMPAYTKDGKIVCHFQYAGKFNTRYAMLMFSDAANLDDGNIWPTAFALPELTATNEAKVIAQLKQAVR